MIYKIGNCGRRNNVRHFLRLITYCIKIKYKKMEIKVTINSVILR